MQLKRLEAYGFKSFADRIVVQFDQGITAVVGPNGSGKSNITDAIRWVLGEQNIRMLRGLRSEDIIFAGSAGRRALSVAEVILVFDNRDKSLPIDFDEVVVKRRLYRNGDSEVYLNDSRCRIKDIYQLFADTGIGHDGMSIIGQNRLNDILDSRPEDRRVFFEETAGITKYRTRKQEALRKLRENDADLIRLNDIMHAHRAELEPLAVQAEKTRCYRALDAERREYQLTDIVRQYDHLWEEQEAQETALHSFQDDEAREMRARLEAEQKKNTLAANIAAIDQRIHEEEQENRRLQEKLDALRQEAAQIKGRQDQGRRREEDIERTRQSADAKITATQQEIVQIDAMLERKGKDYQEKKEVQERMLQELVQLRETLSAEEHKKAEQEKARASVQRVLSRLRENLAVAMNSVQQGDEYLQQQKEELERGKELLADAQQELASRNHQVEMMTQNMQEASQEKEHLHEIIEDLRRKTAHDETQLRQSDADLVRMRQNLDFLKRIQENYEGFGKDVQIVLQASEGWRQGVAGTVADLISIPKDYLTAIETALGGSVRNIVTEDADTAKSAISYLKRKNAGRVTFLPLTTITVRHPRAVDLRRYRGIVGWANTLVQTDDRFQKIADHLLGQTLVMETLDDALSAAKQEGYRLRIVTLTGELLSPGGSLSGGGRRRQQSVVLNRRTEIAALSANLRKHKDAHEAIRISLERGTQLLNEHRQRYEECSENAVHIAQELMDAHAKYDVMQERVADQIASIQKMEQAEDERLLRGARTQQQRLRLERHIAQCKEHERRFTLAIEQSYARETALRTASKTKEDCLHETEIAIAALSTEIETRTRYRQSRDFEYQEAVRALESVVHQKKQLADELQSDTARLSVLEREIAEQDETLQTGEKSGSVLRDQRLAHEAEVRILDDAIRQCLARLENIRGKRFECDKSLERIRIRMEDFTNTLLSDFGLTPDTASEHALDVEPKALGERLKELDESIHALGAVNPNAIEEYEEKKSRHEREEAQIEDLKAAKQDIERIIQKIDQDMTRTFRDAFSQIQEYFHEIFVRLFGGGVAELRLTDKDDILSSGIEILVTLPDKKRQNLSALSGGERALTVIALLFSFLRYRPSPFSVLDEIDAPLDEANVTRFGDFLQEFAQNTQFIVVTHRKGTMRSADTMYGVTVEDAGVSKVLSIRLKDYDKAQSA